MHRALSADASRQKYRFSVNYKQSHEFWVPLKNYKAGFQSWGVRHRHTGLPWIEDVVPDLKSHKVEKITIAVGVDLFPNEFTILD